MGRQQSLGSAWDRPVEPAALVGQQLSQPVVAYAAAASVASVAVAASAAEGGPAAGEASLSSHQVRRQREMGEVGSLLGWVKASWVLAPLGGGATVT